MKIEITEEEITTNPNGKMGRHILLTAEVNGVKFWRMWYQNRKSTLDDKRNRLRRDVELHFRNQ